MPTRSCSALSCDLQRPAQLGVQGAERLVEQQHGRVEHERPRQRHPLLLATGQLARAALLERGQADQLEHLAHLGLDRALVDLGVAQAERHVLVHVQEREQRVALEHGVDVALVRRDVGHVDAVEQHRARRRLLEAGDQAKRGGLAAPGRAEQREELAAGHLQVHAVDRDLVEHLGEVYQLDLTTRHRGYLPAPAPPGHGRRSRGHGRWAPTRNSDDPLYTACTARMHSPDQRPDHRARSVPSVRRAALR